jgi:hypothetical protein
MKQLFATIRSRIGVPAIVTLALVCTAGTWSLSTKAQNTLIDPGSTTGRPSNAITPMMRTFLAEAVAREERAKGLPRPLIGDLAASFPVPICLFERGLCGAINRDGSIAVAPRFDFVDEFREGRAVIRSDGLYGYVDTNGAVVVEPQYAIAGRYRSELAEVDIGGRSALIDLDGRQVLGPRFARAVPFTRDVFWVNDGVRDYRGAPGSEEFRESDFQSGPIGSVFVRGKWGLVDRSGAWVKAPTFQNIDIFDPDNGELMWAQASTGWGLIRPDGNGPLDPVFEYKGKLSGDRAVVWRGGKVGYIDRSGQIVIPPKFDTGASSAEFVDDLPAPAKLGRMVGLIDRSGNWVMEPAYDSISPRGGSKGATGVDQFKGFVVRRGDKSGVLGPAGQVIIDTMLERQVQPPGAATAKGFVFVFSPYDFPVFCADGRIIGLVDQKPRFFSRSGELLSAQGELQRPACDAPHVVKVGEKFGYVDRMLQPVTDVKFEFADPFQNGLAAAKLDGKVGLLRVDGTWAIEPRFDAAQPLTADKALVRVDGRAGIIEVATGNWVTPMRFDDVCSLGRGLVGVMLSGTMGAVDESGDWVVEPNYEPWRLSWLEQPSPVRSNGKWGFVDWAGNTIEAKFDDVRQFERGIAWARTQASWCPIDRRGNKVPAMTCQSTDPNPSQRPHPERMAPCQI